MNIGFYGFMTALAWLDATTMMAADTYFDVVPLACREAAGGTVYTASVDFPVGGDECVQNSAKAWIGEMLEVDATMPEVSVEGMSADRFARLLDDVATDFVKSGDTGHREVRVTWLYEDPTCVSYEAVVTDHDSVVWTTSDVATFSKRDGHRISPEEVFACDESQIKKLMWKYRGDLPMEVASADGLYVGNVAFVDGWVIVVGPARNSSGAEYRLRYPEIEQWLVPAKGDGYLSDSKWSADK